MWEHNSNKLVAVLELRPELCFGSHHRKSILTVALAASEGQEFTSAFFNYVDVLSSWSLSSGGDSFGEGGGFNPSASTLTQCASPGICPVTGTKTGMGSGSSGSKLCLSRVDATPPPPSPLCTVELCTRNESGER